MAHNANGCNTHLVLKMEDIRKYLDVQQLKALDLMIRDIEEGRKKEGKNPLNTYYICNTDEPYAEEVENTILQGEQAKVQEEEEDKERE